MSEKMQWRPIETTPDEGRFLVFGGTFVHEVSDMDDAPDVPIFMVSGRGKLSSAFWSLIKVATHVFDVADNEYYACQVVDPTHWMPLPEPPEDDNDRDQQMPVRLRNLSANTQITTESKSSMSSASCAS